MTGQSVEHDDQLLPELLQICEEFLGQASPATHHELDAFLRARGNNGGPGWLIDMLGFTRYALQHQHQHQHHNHEPDTRTDA